MLEESISMVQGVRQTRLPSRHLTFTVKVQGQSYMVICHLFRMRRVFRHISCGWLFD